MSDHYFWDVKNKSLAASIIVIFYRQKFALRVHDKDPILNWLWWPAVILIIEICINWTNRFNKIIYLFAHFTLLLMRQWTPLYSNLARMVPSVRQIRCTLSQHYSFVLVLDRGQFSKISTDLSIIEALTNMTSRQLLSKDFCIQSYIYR